MYDVENKKPRKSFDGNPYWDADNKWRNGEDWKVGESTTGPSGQTAAVHAFYGVQITWDMLKNVYSREGLANDGEPVKLRVHVRKKKSELYDDAH
ncbi:MAG: hypothetical protein H7Y20_05090 [Bryobacteraceae bacterium]|nr:hypothetical protein [Bryobacteraceae bacterium]